MAELQPVFVALRALLQPCAVGMDCKSDEGQAYSLDTRHHMPNGQPLFFGAVKIGKSYVSYYLMPVYVDPGLLEGLSPELRKRMQGKSCFNFKRIEPALFAELAALTQAGRARYLALGYLPA